MQSRSSRITTALAGALVSALLALGPVSFAAQEAAPRPADSQTDRSMTLASGYHDLALLYIKNGEVDNALAEARKILQLHLPADQEHTVAQSLAIIANRLGEARRFDAAQSLLDETLRAVELDATRARVLMTKARLYRQAGDDRRAIQSYKRALELGERVNR